MEVERDLRPKTIQDLPADILVNIFVKILCHINGRANGKHISLVCRRWYDLEKSTRKHLHLSESLIPPERALIDLTRRYAHLRSIEICYKSVQQKKAEQIGNSCCLCLARGCEKLTDLRLSNCKYVSDVGMAFLGLCPNVEAVRLTNVPCVSGKGLLSLVKGCLSLRLLHIKELNNVKDAEWLEVVGNQRHIDSLGISYCRGFDENQLGALGSRGWGNLREIAFYGDITRLFWNLVPRQLQGWRFADLEGTEYCPNLEIATFAFCLSMSTTGLLWMLGQCKALRKVKIYRCVGVEDEDIRLLAKNNPQVSSLTFAPCDHVHVPKLTNLSLIHIAEMMCDLEHLTLSFEKTKGVMPEFAESGIFAIMDSCTRLTSLILIGIPFLEERTMAAIGCLPSLAKVNLTKCALLNDEVVLRLGLSVTELQLIRCPQLTDGCLDNFRLPHGRLALLAIIDCPRITREAAEKATRNLRLNEPCRHLVPGAGCAEGVLPLSIREAPK